MINSEPKSFQLSVRLAPKAAQNKIQGWAEDSEGRKILKISVTAVPEKGKANKALIHFLAKELKIPKSNIKIIKGDKSKDKALILNDISEDCFDSIK